MEQQVIHPKMDVTGQVETPLVANINREGNLTSDSSCP